MRDIHAYYLMCCNEWMFIGHVCLILKIHVTELTTLQPAFLTLNLAVYVTYALKSLTLSIMCKKILHRISLLVMVTVQEHHFML